MQKTQHLTYTFSELNIDEVAGVIRDNWGVSYIEIPNGQEVHITYGTDDDGNDTEYAYVEWMYSESEGIKIQLDANVYGVMDGFKVYYK